MYFVPLTRQIKRYIVGFSKTVIFLFLDIRLRRLNHIKPNTLLLIRLDAIGDYILFRNFIEAIKTGGKYKDFEITLVGNIAWKEVSLELEGQYVSSFIWLDRKKFVNDLAYRLGKLQEITIHGYEVVINPTFSREFFYGDWIVKVVNAKSKIGVDGDKSNITKVGWGLANRFYTQLVQTDKKLTFEFFRNREIVEKIVSCPCHEWSSPKIQLKDNVGQTISNNYCVLFIGASAEFKKWDIRKFAEVATFIGDSLGLDIVLCGSPAETEDAALFESLFSGFFLNLVGKTTLVELMHVLSKASLLVSNDTSAPHMAAALGVPNIFVLFAGNHYGRFAPYPKNLKHHCTICHPFLDDVSENYLKVQMLHEYGDLLNINDISVEKVINTIVEKGEFGGMKNSKNGIDV